MKALPASVAAAIVAAGFGPLGAQTATPAPPDTEEPAVPSPFEVRTDRDVGYVATSSLAGGRTEMSLKQTAAAISVFTREFLTASLIAGRRVDKFDSWTPVLHRVIASIYNSYLVGNVATNPLLTVPSAYRYLDPRKATLTTSLSF